MGLELWVKVRVMVRGRVEMAPFFGLPLYEEKWQLKYIYVPLYSRTYIWLLLGLYVVLPINAGGGEVKECL